MKNSRPLFEELGLYRLRKTRFGGRRRLQPRMELSEASRALAPDERKRRRYRLPCAARFFRPPAPPVGRSENSPECGGGTLGIRCSADQPPRRSGASRAFEPKTFPDFSSGPKIFSLHSYTIVLYIYTSAAALRAALSICPEMRSIGNRAAMKFQRHKAIPF